MRTQLHNKLTTILKNIDELVDHVTEYDRKDDFVFPLQNIREQREWMRIDLGLMIDTLFVDKVGGSQSEDTTSKIV